jgi:putative nucleotidyltransferase with HDIG domain
MPQTTAQEALSLIERLRAQVHQIKLAEGIHMSISCGIAEILQDLDGSPGDLMRRADLALYEAKSAGRDCAWVWEKTMTKAVDTNEIEIARIKQLQRRVAGLSEKAEAMFMHSIASLVHTLEAKNPWSQYHSQHVTAYTQGIARSMNIGPKQTEIICRAAMLHDIGKVGISDQILLKDGPLSRKERKVMEQHPLIAVRVLEKMNFLEREITIIRHHHEKWNGQGYPDGLAGTAIPLGSRILAVADTLDALTTPRPYRQGLPLDKAVKILVDSSGYDLDPDITKALVTWIESIAKANGKDVSLVTIEDLQSSSPLPDLQQELETTCQAKFV